MHLGQFDHSDSLLFIKVMSPALFLVLMPSKTGNFYHLMLPYQGSSKKERELYTHYKNSAIQAMAWHAMQASLAMRKRWTASQTAVTRKYGSHRAEQAGKRGRHLGVRVL
jgi:putative IMPACT (imprinted ancient) family translation regulator